MTPERFRLLIEGTLAVWRVEGSLSFKDGEASCHITAEGRDMATVSREVQPFGTVWRIQEPGRRDRVHPSVGAALRSLREILCPERSTGRVLFVSEGGP